MTTRELIRYSRRLWSVRTAPAHVNRHNRHAWVRAMLVLGDRWLFAKPVQKVTR